MKNTISLKSIELLKKKVNSVREPEKKNTLWVKVQQVTQQPDSPKTLKAKGESQLHHPTL